MESEAPGPSRKRRPDTFPSADSPPHPNLVAGRGVTRTDFLRGAAALGLAGSLTGFLAACDSGGEDENGPTASGKPQRGGRLIVGIVGAGKRESFNPKIAGENIIINLRIGTHFDRLVRLVDPLDPQPGLALEWTPNKDATVWQFKLRPDVTWHDGKPFGADDVIYSLRFTNDPEHWAAPSVSDVRFGEIKKVNDLTLEVPLKRPNTSFPIRLEAIVQDGATDFRKPVGTGPFKLQSFTVGQRSLSVRNPDYWDEGKPYVDELEFVSIDDESARTNALLSGEVNVVAEVPFAFAQQHKDSPEINLIDTPSTAPHVAYMAVDRPPWNDERVRTAMKLLVDRQALIDGALFGFGDVGNDLFGQGLPFYAESLPQRERDVEQARSLLKQAGYDGDLRVTLETSPITSGVVESATLMKSQAAEAGVTIDVKRVPVAAYYDTSLKYLKMPFAQSVWLGDSLPDFYSDALLSNSPYNETHWRDREFDGLVREAIGATNEDQAKELWLQAQQIQWDKGGNIIWAVQHLVDATAPTVQGIKPSPLVPLGGGVGIAGAWIDRASA